jgi:hypothetical protein
VGKGKGGVLTGRRNSTLRQEARFLLVTADLRAAQLRPWSSQGRRGVQTARARVRDRTIIGPRARAVALPYARGRWHAREMARQHDTARPGHERAVSTFERSMRVQC